MEGRNGGAHMEPSALKHMQPTLEMVEEELAFDGIDGHIVGGTGETAFQGVRPYVPGCALAGDILYVVREADAPRVPPGPWSFVSAAPLRGGTCLLCPGQDMTRVLDRLLELFQRCQAQERRLDELVYHNAGLNELTEAGAEMLGNPICIHDDWFVMIARSAELPQVMQPDYIMSSSREFIPRIIVEDFKNDTEYLETYAFRTARLWRSSPGQPECVYVNLWEGDAYRGRLLVVRYRRDFRRTDYMLAEVLAQRAMALLGMKRLGVDRPHRSMDDIVYDLLLDRQPEPGEIVQLMQSLGWSRDDRMLCVQLRSQQTDDNALMAHALHSDLFRVFPEAYIMFAERRQCVVLNLTRERMAPAMLRHRLAPLCRDYCLYAGMSSPVTGVREWSVAWLEAEMALERAFRLRSDRWIIPFSNCALDALADSLQPPLQPGHLVSPELRQLMEHDRQRDTQYFDTLRTYLLNERDIPRTAEKLIIHRTTLLYRLRKIESIVSINLDDPWNRLYLLMSLWLLDRENA